MPISSNDTIRTNLKPDNHVYIRRLASEEIDDAVPDEALEMLTELDNLFSVHSEDGKRIAIVQGRDAAFAAARAHDLRPSSVH